MPTTINVTDQLPALVAGCETVEAKDGRVSFLRLPAALAAEYRGEEGSRIRLGCPAGVRVRLLTDARAIRLRFVFAAAARPFYRSGLVVDGGEPVLIGPDRETATWEGESALAADGQEHLVELWLPHTIRTDLASLELVDAGGPPRPAPLPNRRWLALGDSITQGMTADVPTDTWVVRCARALDLDVRNYGIGGAKLAAFLAAHPLDWPYDLLTVAYGANDYNVGIPVPTYAANLARLLDRQLAEHPQARAIVVSVSPWAAAEGVPNAAGDCLQDYREAVRAVCRDRPRARAVDGDRLMPADAGFFADHVHPNAAGMARYAESLVPVMREELQALAG